VYKRLYIDRCLLSEMVASKIAPFLPEVDEMSWVGCEETTFTLTKSFSDPDVCTRIRELRAAGASAADYEAALLAPMPPEVAEQAIAELREMPSLTLMALVDAWSMADSAGKAFRVVSERPNRPLEYARKQQVTLAFHSDRDGVTVGVSHVAGRHADWYRKAAAR
jgi:hypothetical protein